MPSSWPTMIEKPVFTRASRSCTNRVDLTRSMTTMIRLMSRMILAESMSAPLRLRPSMIRKVGSAAAGRSTAGGGEVAAKNEAGRSSTGITATQAPIPRSRNE